MLSPQLLERIAELERELISTKLKLACALSSIDNIEHELAIKSSALLRATMSDNNNTTAPPLLGEITIVVPTANPFPSIKTGGDEMTSSCRRRKANMMLDPSSCASALAMSSEIKDSRSRLETADSDPRERIGSASFSFSRGPSCHLNKNSCASGLYLFEKCGASILTSSMLSLSSSVNIKKRSSREIALLFGSRRPLSSSSLHSRRRVRSRTNVSGGSRTAARLGHRNEGNPNMNAEWDEFN
jgi:hypothetical protein